MRIPLIAGNWKMYKNNQEAAEFIKKLDPLVASVEGVEVAVCPPFTALSDVARVIDELNSRIRLGAQNVFPQPEGAFTGEVSPSMLVSLGVHYVIVGHSERREIIGEKDDFIADKVRAVLDAGMTPILCVGETLQEREAGEAMSKVESQLQADLASFAGGGLPPIVIAYEPIWAIGTGKTATPEDAQEMTSFIRQWLEDNHGSEMAEKIRVLYGGSVKSGNISELMLMEDIDGALVGGASLDAEEFSSIVRLSASS
jgi:triosephosphate isomerase